MNIIIFIVALSSISSAKAGQYYEPDKKNIHVVPIQIYQEGFYDGDYDDYMEPIYKKIYLRSTIYRTLLMYLQNTHFFPQLMNQSSKDEIKSSFLIVGDPGIIDYIKINAFQQCLDYQYWNPEYTGILVDCSQFKQNLIDYQKMLFSKKIDDRYANLEGKKEPEYRRLIYMDRYLMHHFYGKHYITHGKYSSAIDMFKWARYWYEKSGKYRYYTEVDSYQNMGDGYRNLKNYPTAMTYYEKAFLLAEGKEDWPRMANVASILGEIALKLKKYRIANRYLKRAIKYKDHLRPANSAAQAFVNLASSYSEANEVEKSIQTYREALQVADTTKDPQIRYQILSRLGLSYRKNKNYVKALESQKKALAALKNERDITLIINELENIGSTYLQMYDPENAIPFFQKALEKVPKHRSMRTKGKLYEKLGIAYRENGNKKKAIETYHKALDISNKTENGENIIKRLMLIGQAYTDLQDYENAKKYYNQALELAIKSNRKYLQAISSIHISFMNSDIDGIGDSRFNMDADYFKSAEQALDISMNFKLSGNKLYQEGKYYQAAMKYKAAAEIIDEIGVDPLFGPALSDELKEKLNDILFEISSETGFWPQ